MGFLLKVKRAKFLLDKARRWMWKVWFCFFIFFTHWFGHINIILFFIYLFHLFDFNSWAWLKFSSTRFRSHMFNELILFFFSFWRPFHFDLQGRGTATNQYKRHWLLEQKLLHFVDAFHQYVMDRVRTFSNIWKSSSITVLLV